MRRYRCARLHWHRHRPTGAIALLLISACGPWGLAGPLAARSCLAQDGEDNENGPDPAREGSGATPRPGLVRIDVVRVAPLSVPVRPGNAKQSLQRFLKAHGEHEAGRLEDALRGYFEFLGMPGRHELPPRYVAMAKERLAKLARPFAERYEKAARLYERDRRAGLAALRGIAERVPYLPAGHAARTLAHTDALRAAIDAAREEARSADTGDKAAIAKRLEATIRSSRHGLFLYEAKMLLTQLGGPDLFAPGERLDTSGRRERDGTPREPERKGEEPTIDIGDGG